MILPFILKTFIESFFRAVDDRQPLDEADAPRHEFLLVSDDTAPPPDDVVTGPVSSQIENCQFFSLIRTAQRLSGYCAHSAAAQGIAWLRLKSMYFYKGRPSIVDPTRAACMLHSGRYPDWKS
jgi:hypothetical protein